MDPGPPWRYTGTLHDGRPLYYSEVMCQIQHSSSTVGRRLLVEVQHATQDSTGELFGVFADDLTPAQRAAKGLPNRPHPSPSGTTTSPKSRQTTLTFPKASPVAETQDDTEQRGQEKRKINRKDRREARPSRTVSFTDDKETQDRRRAAAADSI